MVRKWGATCVGGGLVPRLSPTRKEQIELVLNGEDIPNEGREEFLSELAEAIGRFDINRNLHDASLPSVVRANLNKAIKSAKTLSDRLNSLDGNSCQLIREAGLGNVLALREYSARIEMALRKARELANEYPGKSSGRLPEPRRDFLAADVEDAIATHLGRVPGLSQGRLFEPILEIILEEAIGKEEVKSVHDLAQKTLAYPIKQKHPDGVIEYIPPPDDD